MMPKSWRDELHRQAKQERRPTAKFVLAKVAVACGLAGADGVVLAPRRMTVTERLRKQWLVPGTDAYDAERKRRRAGRAAGAPGGGGVEGDTSSPREDGGGGAGRAGSGPNSGSAA